MSKLCCCCSCSGKGSLGSPSLWEDFLSIPFPDSTQLSAVVLQQCPGVMNCTDDGSDLVWGSFEEIVLRSAFEIFFMASGEL